ncbi:ArnT family glycosyltransferase [Sinomonas mesophila]|uniref:ArnT family glycosyltransferase n=1 Tax=Sinomonas mesophila TaxID=1531955 RepID=UPI001589CCF5|nr:glycosyltransferase family 39 protein [Sinomonas mesophila]
MSAFLNLWNLQSNGWANAYYTAAVQSGLHNAEAFLFGSSEWGNAISVDKPPLSLWLMGLSVRIFGFNSWGLLLPQALLGIATTLLIYRIVRKRTRVVPAFLAGLAYATTPIVVLMSRYNNPDPLLIFLTVAAVAVALRGIENGRVRWLAAAGALLGLAFLTKQLQAMLVVPALAAGVLWTWRAAWAKIVAGAGAALGGLAAVAGSWIAVVELTPKDQRPYVGGSTTNSIVELTLGYNGISRITGQESLVNRLIPQQFVGQGSDAGLFRLLNGNYNQEASWLLVLGLVSGVTSVISLRASRGRLLALISLIWLVTVYLVLSFMGNDIHTYYTMSLAAPIALCVGMAVEAMTRRPRSVPLRATVALGIAASAGIGSLTLNSTQNPLAPALAVASLCVSLLAAGLTAIPPPREWLNSVACILAVAGLAVGPVATNTATLSTSQQGSNPLSGTLTRNPSTISHLLAMVRAGDPEWLRNIAVGAPVAPRPADLLRGAPEECMWAAATLPAQTAANWQLAAERPILPLGGFSAADPFPNLEKFKSMAAMGAICYFVDYPELDPVLAERPEMKRIIDWVRSAFIPQNIDGVRIFALHQ